MKIISNPQEMQNQALAWSENKQKIALVPTMGYLHAGHEALMRMARPLGDKLVLSLFVNPTQFGANEDLSTYPHDFEKDKKIAESLGVDVLFAPQASEVYNPDHATWVEVPELAKGLCGGTRPIHFRGVATVVCKLLMLTQARLAVFGEKDWQQLAIIRRMVRDLNIPTDIQACPIVREPDLLALSSRNVYLSKLEREQAPHLHQGLLRAKELFVAGEKSCAVLSSAVREYWAQHLPLGVEDYLSFVNLESLQVLDTIETKALIAVAVKIGKTRLIDNLILSV